MVFVVNKKRFLKGDISRTPPQNVLRVHDSISDLQHPGLLFARTSTRNLVLLFIWASCQYTAPTWYAVIGAHLTLFLCLLRLFALVVSKTTGRNVAILQGTRDASTSPSIFRTSIGSTERWYQIFQILILGSRSLDLRGRCLVSIVLLPIVSSVVVAR